MQSRTRHSGLGLLLMLAAACLVVTLAAVVRAGSRPAVRASTLTGTVLVHGRAPERIAAPRAPTLRPSDNVQHGIEPPWHENWIPELRRRHHDSRRYTV